MIQAETSCMYMYHMDCMGLQAYLICLSPVLNTTHTVCVWGCLILPDLTSLECRIRKFTELLMVRLFLRMPANIGYIKPEKYKFNHIFNFFNIFRIRFGTKGQP